jgi:hypothetical protein
MRDDREVMMLTSMYALVDCLATADSSSAPPKLFCDEKNSFKYF